MDGFHMHGLEADGYWDHMAPTWLKWTLRNPKWKYLAPYDSLNQWILYTKKILQNTYIY